MEDETRNREIAVIGIGSVLMSDDGVGPTVARLLEASYRFPPQVEVLDAGTPGLGFSSLIAGLKALVVIDAVRADGLPGEVYLYRGDAIFDLAPQPRTNPHDPGLADAIHALQISGEQPEELLLVGVIPDTIEQGTELTPSVNAAVPRLVKAVLAELQRLGVPAEKLPAPSAPDLWWRRHAESPAVS